MKNQNNARVVELVDADVSNTSAEEACRFESDPGHQINQKVYAYILGCYLGDGHIAKTGKYVQRFALYQDKKYPTLIGFQLSQLQQLFTPNKVSVYKSENRSCVTIYCYRKSFEDLFPQHGLGLKHNRPIILKEWQWRIVEKYPREMLKGLIHSDGSRAVVKQKPNYNYVVYGFTNFSPDIMKIFSRVCGLVGVVHTKPSWNRTKIQNRKDVQLLESFIGPKM